MNKHSKFQEIISVWMIFVVLTCLSSCYSTKSVTAPDLSSQNFDKYLYLVHSQDTIYVIDRVSVLDGTLSGKINNSKNPHQIKNKVHIYLSSDSVMKINSENILIIPIDNIARLKEAKVSVGGIIFLSILVIVASGYIWLGIEVSRHGGIL